ncbi:blue copper protein [Vigna unguiculata]|uniref:blue copper protein n=1 Tax=Vigna unguiculata TaxID=3917 RepID=UPI00101600BD|nr:blue copper protein [Vigna unguiculata]
MKQGRGRRSCFHPMSSLLSCLLLFFFCLLGSAHAYKNYTVGDSLGWFDNTEKSNVNYQKWADTKQFTLGDFLIFNTDTNHSVVQTYNFTTYKECDYDDAQDKDTTQWSASDPSNTQTHPVTVAIPLMKEGKTYFFSGDYDGDQCRSGQHFQINVTYGEGLPKSLKAPEDAPSPAGAVSGDDDSAPDTIVPANFNHPKDEESDDDDKASDKQNSTSFSVSVSAQLHVVLLGTLLFFL